MKKKYYVVLPGNKVRGTVYEMGIAGFTPSKYVFRQYVSETIPLILSRKITDDYVYLLEYDVTDLKELFKKVDDDYGITLSNNHTIEVFQSYNNPQFALYMTDEYYNESFLSQTDWLQDLFIYSLWADFKYIEILKKYLKFPKEITTMFDLMGKNYYLLIVFLSMARLQDVMELDGYSRSTFGEALVHLLKSKGLNEEQISILGPFDVIDDALSLRYALACSCSVEEPDY